MKQTHRWRLTLLVIEFVSLIVLLVSIYWLKHYRLEHPHMSAAWLVIPGAASLVLFLSFINMTYLRLVSSALTGGARIARKVAFVVAALVLVGVWILAMLHIYQRLGPPSAPTPANAQQQVTP